MRLLLLRSRRNRCAPSILYISRVSSKVKGENLLHMYNSGFPGGSNVSKNLQKRTVDRALEAISPALTAELERMASGTAAGHGSGFRAKRLTKAVHDAETAVREASGAETQRAIEEA